MEWKYYNPKFPFECQSAWLGHMSFAYDLVRFMKPKRVVELGTYFGASFFSFCQAVKDEGLDTNCFAVDTWIGDPQSDFYGEHVFNSVKKIRDELYAPFATLVRTTFDEAVNTFEDNSIDLLHIDGYHTYDAVSHDFETWLPKLAKNGVVLLHDIAVQWGDFGVYILWEDLKKKYPSIQFEHSFGLGVLFPKGVSSDLSNVLSLKDDFPKIYNKNERDSKS